MGGNKNGVTYKIEINGVEYADKATTSRLPNTAVIKFVDVQKHKVENCAVDIDRLIDSQAKLNLPLTVASLFGNFFPRGCSSLIS